MLHFFLDLNGYPRAHGKGAEQLLGTFLEQDVQGSLDGCSQYMDILARVRSSAIPEWSGTGNVHTVSITPKGVAIENEWAISESAATYSLDDFENALREWAKLISHRCPSRK